MHIIDVTYSYSCNCIVAYIATLSAYINDNLIVASYQLLVSCTVLWKDIALSITALQNIWLLQSYM